MIDKASGPGSGFAKSDFYCMQTSFQHFDGAHVLIYSSGHLSPKTQHRLDLEAFLP